MRRRRFSRTGKAPAFLCGGKPEQDRTMKGAGAFWRRFRPFWMKKKGIEQEKSSFFQKIFENPKKVARLRATFGPKRGIGERQ